MALGAVIVLLAVYYLLYEHKIQIDLKGRGWIVLAASLSGLMGSMYGMSGPPLIFYCKSRRLDSRAFRSTLLAIFLWMGLFRLAFYLVGGFYTAEILWGCAGAMPFALAGLALGAPIGEAIPQRLFQRITSAVLLLSGLAIVAKQMV
jgi:uncharacterized membrane protein YfcA